MFYPHRKKFSITIRLTKKWRRDKVIFLTIPQATIREISEFSMLSDEEKIPWFIKKLASWGANKEAFEIYRSLGKNITEIIKPYFFYSYDIEKIPQSVLNLATSDKFSYKLPESTIFTTIAKEYHIPPHELLKYTMDELYYLINALQYQNLNDDQKEEMQRLQNKKELFNQKEEIQKSFSLLETL